jgi:hypothetical protein
MESTYLSNKNVILSSGGVSYDTNYYHTLSSSSSLVETTYNMGKYVQSLSSLAFGSTSNINIPNNSFIGETYLHVELPNLQVNETLCRGWLYKCIESIQFIFGSSNTSQLTISGETLWTVLSAQIMDSERRSEFFKLGGEEYLQPLAVVPGEDLPKIRATALLSFPWSVACEKIYYDSSLLTNPIVITIRFKSDPKSIYGGNAIHPTSFTSAAVSFRQGDLSNKNLSLRNTMISNPELKYSYPMQHYQTFSAPESRGFRESEGSLLIPLTGFINSDLVGIYFFVTRKDSDTPINNNSPCAFNCEELTNIRLTYNGETVYYTPGNSHKLVNMIGQEGASYWQNSVIRPGNVAPFNSDPVDSYMCYIDFSKVRSACTQMHMWNVWRTSNQTLNLSLNTKRGNDTIYKPYVTFCYNGVVSTQNGQSNIYFD